ncbi:MAG: hypothetical protein IJZ17_02640 [Muribaculaceae bacterium]|nr:hypothetical protein [Muribaculaceae bacterium]
MRKRNFLLVSALATMLSMSAQDFILPTAGGTGEALLPEGVTANIKQGKKYAMDKNMVIAGSEAKGYKAYFAADNGVNGEELWATDGTAAGTYMVKDIYPGATSSNITWLTRFGEKVVFAATGDEDTGNELWISDGTEEGTYMFDDIDFAGSSNPIGFCQLDETRFVFFASSFDANLVEQMWLWISDGVACEDVEAEGAGTYLLAAVDSKYPGTSYDNLFDEVMRVGRKVYFKADMSDKDGVTYGEELWVTDGTVEGTHMVADVNKEINTNKEDGSTNGAAVTFLRPAADYRMIFKAWSEETGNEMWITDGTEAGTYVVDHNTEKNPETGIGAGSDPTMVGQEYNGQVAYRGFTPGIGHELVVVDFNTNTSKAYDVNVTTDGVATSDACHSFPDTGMWFDGKYVFCAVRDGFDNNWPSATGGELQVYDPSNESCYLQYNYGPAAGGCNWVKEPIVVGGSMYWWNEGNIGVENSTTKLHRLDAVTGVPCIVSNISAQGDNINTLRNLNGTLIFASNTTKQVYSYTYRSDVANLELNPDVMELDFGPKGDTGIENVVSNAATVAVEYYNIQGQKLNAAPANGLYIKKAIKADGSVEAVKAVK